MTRPLVSAYKFTAANGQSPYGGGVWTVGRPRSARQPLVACESGIHYCKPEHLGWWINAELYEFEDLTPGEAFEHERSKMVTRKGVLVARVKTWTPQAMQQLVFLVSDRALRVHAVSALRLAGLDDQAEKLIALPAIMSEATASAAGDAARAAGDAARAAGDAAWAAGYAARAAGYAAWGTGDAARAAGYAAWAAGYAAWAAGDAARAAGDAAWAAERRWISKLILELAEITSAELLG